MLRLYYTERIWETTYFGCFAFTAANMLYIRKGYFAPLMRTRLLPCWAAATTFNLGMTAILCLPLRKEEIQVQVKKRIAMGKWLFSLFHLDPIDDGANKQ